MLRKVLKYAGAMVALRKGYTQSAGEMRTVIIIGLFAFPIRTKPIDWRPAKANAIREETYSSMD
jgi:hypothetical protein